MRVPKYRLQRSTGRALIELFGRRIYLGKYGSAKSKALYKEKLAEWSAKVGDVATGTAPPAIVGQVLIKDLILRYWLEHATVYYVKRGKPTSEQGAIRVALKTLRRLYGDTPAAEFDEVKLETYRDELIEGCLSITTINGNVGRLRRAFRWAARKKLIPAATWQQLLTVENLKSGRTKAKPARDVQPVADETIMATLPYLSEVVAAMVRFQRLTGCRPGEVCQLRPCDIERPSPGSAIADEAEGDAPAVLPMHAGAGALAPTAAAEVWIYRPETHKTEHHGAERRIFVGPKAQEVLRPWLDRDLETHCFSPREAAAQEGVAGPASTQAQRAARPRKSRRGACYTKDSYRRAIVYALTKLAQALGHEPPKSPRKGTWRAPRRAWFESVGVAFWHPNQIRHTAATELRSAFDLEGTQTVLGHRHAKTTEIYAERDFARAAEIMRELG